MKQSVSLDLEARRLIDLASPEPPPSEEACRRMSLKLAPLLAPGAGSPLPEPSVEVHLPAALNRGPAVGLRLTTSSLGKLAFGAGSVALMAGAFWLGRATSQRAEPVSAVEPQVVSALHTELIEVGRVEPTEPALSAERAAAAPAAVSKPSAAAPAAVSKPSAAAPAAVSKPSAARPSRSPDAIALLGEAELALRRQNPKAALAKLDELGQPTSTRLSQLSRVLRAIALCDAGRHEQGRHLVEQLREERGSSVFAARLKHACEIVRR